MTAEHMKHRITFGHIEIGETGRAYIQKALDRNWVSQGSNVAEFESAFGAKFGYSHAIATSSGTDAGLVAMASLYDRGARRGDEIITPALAFVATANVILAAGFVPRFVDIDLNTLNIDPTLIEAAITPQTRAIQVVHTMGKPCHMRAVMDIARRNNLIVIEDCCEAHGATLGGQIIGSFGSMGLFSFYAAHIICSGEGGMISTNDSEFADLCRSVRSHGRRDGELYFHFDRIGFNSKMNDLEAAVGLEGLENFEQTFATRRRHLIRLQELLSSLEDRFILYRDGPGETICPHAFPIVLRSERVDIASLYAHLESNGVQCKTLFGSLPTQHRAFEFLGHRKGGFPVAERIGRTGLHFGLHQFLTDDDVEYIAETLLRYYR
jgi:dTDP-4-amino-4,6-dideoxygalactose transaminase